MNAFDKLVQNVSALATAFGNALQLRGFLPGGDAGQVQRKASGDDFDMEWADLTADLEGEGDPNGGFITLSGVAALSETLPRIDDINAKPAFFLPDDSDPFVENVSGNGLVVYESGDGYYYAAVVAGGAFNLDYATAADPADDPWSVVAWTLVGGLIGTGTLVVSVEPAVTATPGTTYNQIVADALVAKWVNISPGLWKRIRFIEDEPS